MGLEFYEFVIVDIIPLILGYNFSFFLSSCNLKPYQTLEKSKKIVAIPKYINSITNSKSIWPNGSRHVTLCQVWCVN